MVATIEIQGSAVGPGDRVVYPNGGICKVRGIERKSISGYDLVMLVLQREEDDAVVMVPQGKVASIGLRKVATGEAIKLLFEYFTGSSTDPELDWKVRHRDNTGLMAAGGLLDTAKVLKGLHALAQIRPLPTKEREMYDSARHQLIGEIAASLNLPPAVAENNIDYALTPPPGSGRTAPKDAPIDIKSLRRSMGGSRKSASGDDMDLDEESEDPILGLDEEAAGEEGSGEEGAEAEASSEETPAAGGDEDADERAAAKAGAKAPAKKAKAPAKEKAPAMEKAPAREKAPAKGKAPAKKAKDLDLSEETEDSEDVEEVAPPKKPAAKATQKKAEKADEKAAPEPKVKAAATKAAATKAPAKASKVAKGAKK